MLIKLSFLPHGLKNTVSSFIAQHGKASLHHGRKTMLLGLFLFGVAKKGSTRANSQTTRKPEGSFSLVLARCNYARSISPLSVNTLKGSYQVSVFRAGKCKACTGCARSHLPRLTVLRTPEKGGMSNWTLLAYHLMGARHNIEVTIQEYMWHCENYSRQHW